MRNGAIGCTEPLKLALILGVPLAKSFAKWLRHVGPTTCVTSSTLPIALQVHRSAAFHLRKRSPEFARAAVLAFLLALALAGVMQRRSARRLVSITSIGSSTNKTVAIVPNWRNGWVRRRNKDVGAAEEVEELGGD
jgi:hypothetical protein